MDRLYLTNPDPEHLSQGDVVTDVPLTVAPDRIILLDDVAVDKDQLSARRLTAFPTNGTAYALTQVELVDAVILTYDCDIDRGLENIVAGNERDPVELITVTAVRPAEGNVAAKINDIRAGRMPRFAQIEATTTQPQMFVDFASIQQISLRVIVPLAFRGRRHGMNGRGQWRLIERMAHALGDIVRRGAAGNVDDPMLFKAAYDRLSTESF